MSLSILRMSTSRPCNAMHNHHFDFVHHQVCSASTKPVKDFLRPKLETPSFPQRFAPLVPYTALSEILTVITSSLRRDNVNNVSCAVGRLRRLLLAVVLDDACTKACHISESPNGDFWEDTFLLETIEHGQAGRITESTARGAPRTPGRK